jgi:signal transduction histidine kinase
LVSRAAEPGVRILVVEDEPQVRRMLALLLGARWNVELADGGEAAWRLARAAPPDLVISDVRMPGMDGIALLRRLRADATTQTVPVILVTARAGEQETIAGLEAGADDFLIKPFSARELLVRVQTRLEVTAMRRRNAQQAEALAALERHTEWTEKLLGSLPVPLLLLEPMTARILFANRAARRLTGAPLDRGEGLCDQVAFRYPEDEGGQRLEASEMAPSVPSVRTHFRRIVLDRPDGSLCLLADSEVLPEMHDRAPVAVLTLRDITELLQKETDLRRALRLRDEFLSVASHELRTPITTLTLQTDAALKGLTESNGHGNERLARRLSSIRGQVMRLAQLAEALLDVSRLTEGRLELHPEDIDLRSVAAEAIESLREPATRAGSPVRLSGDQGVTGHWDRLRISQVITNLLSNAIKFGRGQPIDVEVASEGDRASVSVRDAGIGIAPEESSRIFQRFERASSEKHYPGLGLGLWIAKQIVDACHGTITVDSRPGAGSTFTLELPRAT